jgi:hypothetical protein
MSLTKRDIAKENFDLHGRNFRLLARLEDFVFAGEE